MCARSYPIVVISPCPGYTTVSSGSTSNFSRIDSIICENDPPHKSVRPMLSRNSVSPAISREESCSRAASGFAASPSDSSRAHQADASRCMSRRVQHASRKPAPAHLVALAHEIGDIRFCRRRHAQPLRLQVEVPVELQICLVDQHWRARRLMQAGRPPTWSICVCVLRIARTFRSCRFSMARMRSVSSPGSTTIASCVVASPRIEQLHCSIPTGITS